MNAIPCIASRNADRHANKIEPQEAIDARAIELQAEMWQDLSELSDAFNDAGATIGWYRVGAHRSCSNHPQAAKFLSLIRDGSDDLELARMLREAMRDYISDTAGDRAEGS